VARLTAAATVKLKPGGASNARLAAAPICW
jgi:hypothetical protein